MSTHYLACDLGAESGRLMLGVLENGRLTLEELHRFPNTPLSVGGSLHWDITRLWQELKAGLKIAAQRQLPIASISTDSWGVDYLFLDRRGDVLPPTFHYRDPRTAQGVAAVRARVDWPTLFAETGIQFMPLNTIYQLAAESEERLRLADYFLMIADAFNYLLCDSNQPSVEESNASTTQLYNPRLRTWSKSLLTALNLPERLFPPVIPSGTRLGRLRPALAKDVGLPQIEVLATCSHDTGAAVAAVPCSAENRLETRDVSAPRWAYLSSGTWSLMGVELASPLLTDACRELNFTNEIGYGGSVRLLKNISGLWLVQECRRAWAAAGHEYDYASLTRMAGDSPAFRSLVEPTDERFVAPGGMTEKMAAFCRETNQPVPETPGAFVRCALESLALLYRRTLQQIEQLTGTKVERLHIVGGGSRNMLLNEFTANALQLPVLTGPVEATAIGNVLIQAITLGHLSDLKAARAVVRQSFELTEIKPRAAGEWEEAFRRFEKLKR